MHRRLPSPSAIVITSVLLVGFAVWTTLVELGTLEGIDRATAAGALDPHSAYAQILSAIAILTWPGVEYAVLVGVALWAFTRRQRNLAAALVLSVVLGSCGGLLIKAVTMRPRPPQHLDVITALGWSYPSGHVLGATVAACMIAATEVVTRRSFVSRTTAQVLGVLGVVGVALMRWALGAHWLSDLIGGALLGGLVCAISMIVAGVKVLPANPLEVALPRRPLPEPTGKQAAIIINPTKVLDMNTFRRVVGWEFTQRGWESPIWLETTRHDPGYAMTDDAVGRGVDLVLGAGGDGTVRAICESLAGTGIPFGLIPAGTGNLLARNLSIPLDESAALRLALEGTPRPIDLVRLTVDPGQEDQTTHVFGVMGGIGIDAAIMERTDQELKKAVGAAAYLVAVAQTAKHPPLPVRIRVDDGDWFRRRATVLLVGNVGVVTGNIQLIAGATADDGLLDLLVASPRTPADWARLTTKVLTRKKGSDPRMDLVKGRRVEVIADRDDAYQVDGDTEGRCSHMVFEVMPGALQMMLR